MSTITYAPEEGDPHYEYCQRLRDELTITRRVRDDWQRLAQTSCIEIAQLRKALSDVWDEREVSTLSLGTLAEIERLLGAEAET